MIEVTAPDGTVVEFPEGTNEETIKRVMSRFRVTRPQAAAVSLGDLVTANTIDELGGLIFGGLQTAAEAVGGNREAQTRLGRGLTQALMPGVPGLQQVRGASLAAEPVSRKAATQELRGLQQRAREQHPVTYYGTQVAGSLVPVAGQMGRGGQALQAARGVAATRGAGEAAAKETAQQVARRYGGAAIGGGATAGLYGVGEATGDPLERLQQAAPAAGFGAVAAPVGAAVLPAAINVASPIVSQIREAAAPVGRQMSAVVSRMAQNNDRTLGSNFGNLFAGGPPPVAGPRPPQPPPPQPGERGAIRQLVRGMRQDDLTPADIQAEAAAARAAGYGDVTRVGNLGGPSMGETWRTFGLVKGPTRGMTTTALEEVRGGAVERLQSLGQRMLNPSGRSAFRTLADLDIGKRQQAGPLYARADRTPVTPSLMLRVQSILDTDYGRQALAPARRIAQAEGVTLPPEGDYNFATLRYVREGLDALIDRERDPTTRRLTREGQAISNLRRQLDGALKDASPDLRNADRIYASASRQRDALEAGRKVFNTQADEIGDEIGRLSEVEQAAYRTGVFQAIMDRVMSVGDAPTADATRKIAGNALLRTRLRQAFPNEDAFNEFMAAIRREVDFVQRARQVDPEFNSRTAPALMGLADTFSDMLTGGNPVASVGRNVAQRLGLFGNQLMSRGPANVDVNRAFGQMVTRPVSQSADIEQMIMDEYVRQLMVQEAARRGSGAAGAATGATIGGATQ